MLYNAEGKAISYKKTIQTIEKKDILLFGEIHNNPISHWLQIEITKSVNKNRDLILGAEMFERDNQKALSDYVSGKTNETQFDTTARLWPNYSTDYAPLVNYAREQHIRFIATNIPRRFASMVYKNDFYALDSLSTIEKSWIAPLPILYDPTLPNYVKISEMLRGHSSPTLVKAQAIKDATMAHFILENYTEKKMFVHYNGTYHSNNHEGIYWYLKQLNKSLDIVTIATVEQEDVNDLDKTYLNLADIIICVDDDMTKTF
jgi:uncharacterized iron-regulated protein